MNEAGGNGRIIIKKYANRRLYDTANSRYVNLRDIAKLIKGGDLVEVIDTTSGEDVTKIVLAQIIMEEEKGQRNLLPTEFLHQIIKDGEEAYAEVAEKLLAPGLAAYKAAQEHFESAMTQWLKPWSEASKPREAEEIERLKNRVAELEARLAASKASRQPPRRSKRAAPTP